jgi:tetratricopeptide (TPR) repeat protein
MRRALLSLLPIAFFLLPAALADTITLRDGKRVVGKIVADDGKKLTVEKGSGKVDIDRSSVLAIVHDDATGAGDDGATSKTDEKPAATADDGLPEATRLEREALALEQLGKFREGLDKLEASLTATLDSSAKADERGARVEYLIRRLSFFWNKTGEHARGEKSLRAVLANKELAPYPKDVARWYLTGQLRAQGNNDDADREQEKLGWGTHWLVCGTFDNERGTGFSTAYGPETDPFDPAATFKGKKRDVIWRPTPLERPIWGEIDLKSMLRPNEQGLAYAISYLKVDEPTKVVLRLGSAEALKVFVDRVEVSSEEKRRPLKFDQTHVGLELKAGWHEVLLKVCAQTGPWAFRCRITAPEGGPAKGVRWAATDEIRSKQELVKDGAKPFEADKGAFTWLEARRKAAPKDHRNRFRLGYLYYTERPFDDNEHSDREVLDEACKLAPDEAVYQVFYSHTAAAVAEFSVNKEENKRREALERALEVDPRDALAAWFLAGYYESSLANVTRAEELVRKALAANPDYTDAELTLLGIEERRGLHPIVERRLAELASSPEAHRYVPLMRRLLDDCRRRGDVKAQSAWILEIAATDRTDPGPLHELAGIAMARGRLDAAAKLYQQAIALAPWNVGTRMQLAQVHEQQGDLAAAETDLKAALEIAPEDHALLERLGHLIEREGREDEGRAKLDKALELEPTLVELKKYLEWLDRKKEGTSAWEEEWKLDAEKVLALAKDVPTDNNLYSRVLLRNIVVKVNPDGTCSRFKQELVRVENEEGKKQLREHGEVFNPGEQKSAYKVARVYKKNGEIVEAPLSETTGEGGEFRQYKWHPIELDSGLEVGDVIEIQYRQDDLAQSFFGDYFGDDVPIAEFGRPIDHLRYAVIMPKEKKLYVHTTVASAGLDAKERVDEAKKVKIYSWEKTGIAKIEPEPNMPWARESLPVLQVSTFGDWNSFAKWYWGLVKKQQEADESIRKKVAELTKDCKTDEDKIRKIYNYVVTDIRYNSAWEFGVHGFKPYNATSIFSRKFGDCKDKATLINTMLGEVGIKSYPVLIFGDNPRGKEDLSLPLMHHFNHCISYVPSAKGGEGMWLDGTAQFHPFDTLPTMDYGATTLIVQPDKGELKTIPFRGPDADYEKERHDVKIRPDGGAEVRSVFEGTGDFNYVQRMSLTTKGRREEVLEQRIGRHYSGAKVKSVKCSDLENLDEAVKVEVEYGIPKIFQKSTGGYQLDEIRSWLFDGIYSEGQKLSAFAAKESRDFDVVLKLPSGVEETITYELPAGMDAKSLPAETKLKNEFGSYTRTYTVEKGKIKVVRRFEMKTNRIPKDKYDDFRKFVGDIERAENERVLLSKEGGEE